MNEDKYGNTMVSLFGGIRSFISDKMYFKYVRGMQPLYRIRSSMK